MGIKRFPVGADEGLVEKFDEVAYRRRVSRNRLIVELMERAVREQEEDSGGLHDAMMRVVEDAAGGTVSAPPLEGLVARFVPATERPQIVAELREKVDKMQAKCSHPKEKRKNLGYGTRCEECGGMVK